MPFTRSMVLNLRDDHEGVPRKGSSWLSTEGRKGTANPSRTCIKAKQGGIEARGPRPMFTSMLSLSEDYDSGS